MNIQVQIQICRACLKPSEATTLVEYNQDSELMKNYLEVIGAEPSPGLPRSFCEKCVKLSKIASNFRKTALRSENYLKSFVEKINQEFTKSLPSLSSTTQHETDNTDTDDPDLDQMLLTEKEFQEPDAAGYSGSEMFNEPVAAERPKAIKQQSTEKSPEKPQTIVRKIEKPKAQTIKLEKSKSETMQLSSDKRDFMEAESSALYDDEEEQLDDEENMFGEEIYDIMEIENEGSDNIYIDENGKQVIGDEDGDFILVNFKSSNEDLTEKEQQFVVEELYDDDPSELKPTTRKKHVNRMPREIIDKYAKSTDNNQHICTKCVKVFSTRTNLIRHIQSHDGYKAYVCEVCNKGFTQSGSLKQHMYIHSGERPYKCQYCDRAFTQGKTLKFHLRRHTEEKPFVCTVCNSSFRQRDGLKRHLKSRHNIELKYSRNNQLNDSKVIAFVNSDQETADPKDTKVSESAVEESKTDSVDLD